MYLRTSTQGKSYGCIQLLSLIIRHFHAATKSVVKPLKRVTFRHSPSITLKLLSFYPLLNFFMLNLLKISRVFTLSISLLFFLCCFTDVSCIFLHRRGDVIRVRAHDFSDVIALCAPAMDRLSARSVTSQFSPETRTVDVNF